MTQSLGEKLASRIQRDEEAERARKEAEEHARITEENRKRKVVTDYFGAVRNLIEGAINAEQPIPRITLGKSRNKPAYDVDELSTILKTYQWPKDCFMTDSDNPYFSIWYAFDMWANDNGLSVKLEQVWDDVYSWHELKVTPKSFY